MMSYIATTTTNQFYADVVNSQFADKNSHFVTLSDRLRRTVGLNKFNEQYLTWAMEDFKSKHPEIKSWNDIKLPLAQSTTLDKIRIDITLQRTFDFLWGREILINFDEIYVQPLHVYEVPESPGNYICWDGQHTGIVLDIIASKILREDRSKCVVPIVIHPYSKKLKMRKKFIELNGDAKKPVELIDIFQQMIFGVRVDGADDKDWAIAEEKQRYLEEAKMFATHSKFNDTDEPGALTRMQELMDRRYSPVITKYFTQYFVNVCRSSRPVNPKEAVFLYEYLRQCEHDENIHVDDNYIRDVAKALQVVNSGDFDAQELWDRAKSSYQDYYRETVRGGLDLLGIRYPEKPLALTFLIAQIEKAGVAVPDYSDTMYEVPEEDLF